MKINTYLKNKLLFQWDQNLPSEYEKNQRKILGERHRKSSRFDCSKYKTDQLKKELKSMPLPLIFL